MLAVAAFRDLCNISGACVRAMTGYSERLWVSGAGVGVALGFMIPIQGRDNGNPKPSLVVAWNLCMEHHLRVEATSS